MAAPQREIHSAPSFGSELRALGAALLLFAGIVAFGSSCGGGDVTFPGNVVQTATPQFTATP
jgi:hypothetical protein